MPLTYSELRKLGYDDQLASLVSGNSGLKFNGQGTRPSYQDAIRMEKEVLLSTLLSGFNPDGTEHPGIVGDVQNVIKKPSENSSSEYVYVATTGDDTDGDGTEDNPYLTIGQAFAKAADLRVNGKIYIKLADGTYTLDERQDIPYGAAGVWQILGNASNKSAVRIEHTDAALGVCLYANNPAVTLEVKGVTFQNAFVALYAYQNVSVYWLDADTDGVNYVMVGGPSSVIECSLDSDGDSTWNGDATNDSIAVSISSSATFVNYQNITVTNFTSGIFASFNSYLGMYGSGVFDIDTSGSANPFAGISIRHQSMMFGFQRIDVDHGVADTNQFGIEVSTSYLSLVFGATMNFTGCEYGIYAVLSPKFLSGGNTFTYTGCTTDVFLDYDFSGSADDTFDTTDIEYGELVSNRIYGFDKRYQPHQQIQEGSATTTDATVTVLETVDMSTPNTVYLMRTHAAAVRDTAAEGAVYELKGGFRNDAGVLSQIGAGSALVYFKEDDASWTMDYNISGTNVEVRCTGAAGKNIDWKSTSTVTQSST